MNAAFVPMTSSPKWASNIGARRRIARRISCRTISVRGFAASTLAMRTCECNFPLSECSVLILILARMAKAIALLLEKDSKARRESDANARDVSTFTLRSLFLSSSLFLDMFCANRCGFQSMAPSTSVPPSPGLVPAAAGPAVPVAPALFATPTTPVRNANGTRSQTAPPRETATRTSEVARQLAQPSVPGKMTVISVRIPT